MKRSIGMAGGIASTRVCMPVLPLLALGLLVGCGGGSSTTSAVPSSPAAAVDAATVSASDAVATVAGVPIAKASYTHWLAVEQKLGAPSSPSHQALGFLITSEWVLGEASGRHMSVSEAEVKRRYAQLVHQSFPKAGSLRKYLAKSGETEADLLARIKVELLASRIAAKITTGKSSSQRTAVLAAFEKSFQRHWKSVTSCSAGYVMEDCRQYRGKPEHITASTSSASSSRGAGSGGASSASSGEVYTAPGAFSLASSAFERNGAIPVEYTCAGKGISPPLSWQKVPAKAAELFLFVIDDNSSNKSGGIRWVVGNIDPSSTGVAAGQTPQGGIAGRNADGKDAYSPICPPKGKSDTIEFVMYALSKKIQLSPGFTPATAEADYGSHKLLMGQAAVNYGIASR
jgi:Raf kinase inhibitor-like YbhB/YbcL family protein